MRKAYTFFITGAVLLVNSAPFLSAQSIFKTDYLKGFGNSNLRINSPYILTITEKADDTLKQKPFNMKNKPWKAVLLSALIPGAGQFYNHSYWKIPVILGLCGYFGYTIYDQHKKYSDYRERYAASQTPENPFGDLYLKSVREFYFNQRNDFIWYFMITYLVNLVDAFVDAHLLDFDVSEEKITLIKRNNLKYTLRFSLNF
jgi:hypothetical protein